MIIVFSPQLSPRIRYIFKLILGELLGDEPLFTSSTEEFAAAGGPKINYSKDPKHGGLFFEAHGLLSEKDILNQETVFPEGDQSHGFFAVYNKQSAMNFDPFAASFYLVTRYEEYLPYVRDEYGRFQAVESLAWKKGFLDKPVVNTWAGMIAEKISQKWPSWQAKKPEYRFIPTIDINAAWRYKRKGFFRTVAGLANSLSNIDFGQATDRIRVVSNLSRDPFDTYDAQLALNRKYGLDTIYFVLFADYDTNDRNTPVGNRHFRILIKTLADYCRIGIHTSFASLKSTEKLDHEFRRLSAVLNKDINMTRQHFHVLNMPLTYRGFVNRDVENDYSMGYAVTPGFRAGICSPFNFYDLDFEVETPMRIWPFAIVDKGLEQGFGLEDSFSSIIARVKAVNGTLVTLWNNESLVSEGAGPVNIGTYETVIRMALQ